MLNMEVGMEEKKTAYDEALEKMIKIQGEMNEWAKNEKGYDTYQEWYQDNEE